MSHLPTERLAVLGVGGGQSAGGATEPPTPEEQAHLSACPDCARERLAFQRLADLAGAESARLAAPLTNWESMRSALVVEGMIPASIPAQAPAAPRVRRGRQPWLQAAAAVLLMSGGVVAGRYSAGASVVPVSRATASSRDASTQGVGTATTVAADTIDSLPRFASLQEARAAQERSQLVYQTATAFIAERDTNATQSVASMQARLTALDRTRQVMGEALNKAPYDPVLNGYYLSTVGQRDATLRQINTVMPVSMRISSY